MIGRFIDDMCKAHPVLMLDVLGREFGNFGSWVDGCRGCLVGSVLLAQGSAEGALCDAEVMARFVRFAPEFAIRAMQTGVRVADAHGHIWEHMPSTAGTNNYATAHAKLSRLIKARIERALGTAHEPRVVGRASSPEPQEVASR